MDFINMKQCCGHWKNWETQNDQFFIKEVEIFKKHFIYAERLASAKIEKVLWLKRNDEKVTLLLIYHISGFSEKYSLELYK